MSFWRALKGTDDAIAAGVADPAFETFVEELHLIKNMPNQDDAVREFKRLIEVEENIAMFVRYMENYGQGLANTKLFDIAELSGKKGFLVPELNTSFKSWFSNQVPRLIEEGKIPSDIVARINSNGDDALKHSQVFDEISDDAFFQARRQEYYQASSHGRPRVIMDTLFGAKTSTKKARIGRPTGKGHLNPSMVGGIVDYYADILKRMTGFRDMPEEAMHVSLDRLPRSYPKHEMLQSPVQGLVDFFKSGSFRETVEGMFAKRFDDTRVVNPVANKATGELVYSSAEVGTIIRNLGEHHNTEAYGIIEEFFRRHTGKELADITPEDLVRFSKPTMPAEEFLHLILDSHTFLKNSLEGYDEPIRSFLIDNFDDIPGVHDLIYLTLRGSGNGEFPKVFELDEIVEAMRRTADDPINGPFSFDNIFAQVRFNNLSGPDLVIIVDGKAIIRQAKSYGGSSYRNLLEVGGHIFEQFTKDIRRIIDNNADELMKADNVLRKDLTPEQIADYTRRANQGPPGPLCILLNGTKYEIANTFEFGVDWYRIFQDKIGSSGFRSQMDALTPDPLPSSLTGSAREAIESLPSDQVNQLGKGKKVIQGEFESFTGDVNKLLDDSGDVDDLTRIYPDLADESLREGKTIRQLFVEKIHQRGRSDVPLDIYQEIFETFDPRLKVSMDGVY